MQRFYTVDKSLKLADEIQLKNIGNFLSSRGKSFVEFYDRTFPGYDSAAIVFDVRFR